MRVALPPRRRAGSGRWAVITTALLGLISTSCSSGGDQSIDAGSDGSNDTDSGVGVLTVAGPDLVEITGPVGGPFDVLSSSYELRNEGSASLDWLLIGGGSWLEPDSTTGSLTSGQSRMLVVNLRELTASTMAAGNYEVSYLFSNTTSGEQVREVRVRMSIFDPEGSLDVTPVATQAFAGELGGPFTPDEHLYQLSNPGDQSIDWTASSDQAWLRLATTSGSLAPGETQDVAVTIDEAVAGGMQAGQHQAFVQFTNTTNGAGDAQRRVTLRITLPPGVLSVSPAEDYLMAGTQGGPFFPATKTYQLSNTGQQGIDWTFTSSVSWLAAQGSASGHLDAGESTSLVVALNQDQARTFSVGTYVGTLTILDALGEGAVLGATLVVDPAPAELAVTPQGDLVCSGGVGGPFFPLNASYTLTNIGGQPLQWAVNLTQSFFFVAGATSGLLAPGASTQVTVELDSGAAQGMPPGTHAGSARFAADSVVVATRATVLEIAAGDDDEAGWTDLTPSVDTRTIYVSSSEGSDSNNGLSEATPKRTIAAGAALLRDGMPDWLLLKKGDVWTGETLSSNWSKSGRSLGEPMVVTSYGTGARPLLRTGSGSALSAVSPSQSGGNPVHDLAFVDLHFHAHDRQGQNNAGIAWLKQTQNLLIEGCFIEEYKTNIEFPTWGGDKTGVRIRRNVLVDAYYIGAGTDGHGLFMSGCPQALIEENVFDHNGWNDTHPGTVFRHSMYITGTSANVTVRGNIVSNGASHGMQLRIGGTAENNLFVRCSIAMHGGGGDTPVPGGVQINFLRNVILDGKNIVNGSENRGWGIDLANISQGTIAENIIAHQTIGSFRLAMNLYGATSGDGVHNVTLRDNVIYNWGGPILLHGNSSQITNLSIEGNHLQDLQYTNRLLEHAQGSTTGSVASSSENLFFNGQSSQSSWIMIGGSQSTVAQWASQVDDTSSQAVQAGYPDANRTLATYHATIGGTASHDAFIAEARKQAKGAWRTEYEAGTVNDYIRAGFGNP